MHATFSDEPLTRSVEDYLKAIYRLSAGGETASTSQIAHLLKLSPPSVSGMVKRLSEQGFLEHVPYKGVQLTPEGRRAALRTLRRHRLIETYLVEFLGYSWDTVHEEAERLEHAVSDLLVERMASAMGYPTTDPHGDPIPSADGSLDEEELIPLTKLPSGQSHDVRRVLDADSERLRYLASLGLRPGTMVTVVEQQPFDGPLTIRIGTETHVLGRELAGMILCAAAATVEDG